METALDSIKENSIDTEIAFFGGSFTAIDRDYMRALLEATVPYTGRFRGIRISTRPDCIDEDILAVLRSYRVSAIELGAQSMCDHVLLSNDRGHTAEDVRRAARLIKNGGFELGLQMMTGLYETTDALDIETARQFIGLCPDTVRIYPTIVMKNTRLGTLYQAGLYRPQELDGAVSLCAELIGMFEARGIRVIRVGLHDTPSLRRDRIAGPYHPAFRELCESRIMLFRATELLGGRAPGRYTLRVAPGSRSKMTGQKKSNIAALRRMGYDITIREDASLSGREIAV